MVARIVVFFALTACTGAPGEPAPGKAEPVNDGPKVDLNLGDTLAEVGGIPVGSREFVQVAARRLPADGKALSKEEKLEILDDLIDQKALYLEAKRLGIDQDPKIQRQMIQIMLRQTVYSQVKSLDISDDELKQYFEAHRDEFVIPEKARVRRILIKAEPTRSSAEAKAMAEAAHKQIGGDIERFAKVATEVSEGPFADRGGDVGQVSRTGRPGMGEEAVERAFGLEIGQVSEPFEADGGWNIVAMVTKRERVDRTFEQVRGAVLRRAKADRHTALYEETVKRLRAELDVQTNPQALDDLSIAGPQRADGLRRPIAPQALPSIPVRKPFSPMARPDADDEPDEGDEPLDDEGEAE
jgi:peptidyl-prolyl cis-trans isomerase C